MSRRRAIIWGSALILLGCWALLASRGVAWARMDRLWPAVLIVGGGLALRNALRTLSAGDLWFGLLAIGSGGIFLYITLGSRWHDLVWLWPAFPLVAGLAWVAAWLLDLKRAILLGLGLAALAVAAVGLLHAVGTLLTEQSTRLAGWWPLLLVGVGLSLVVQFWARRS